MCVVWYGVLYNGLPSVAAWGINVCFVGGGGGGGGGKGGGHMDS